MQRIAKSNRDDRCVIFYIIEFFTDSLILSTKAWYSTTSNTRKCKTLRGREVCHGASMSLLVLFTSVFSVKFGERIWFPTHPWKYLNYFLLNSRPWKYLKTGQVLESAWISFHRSLKVVEFSKSNCTISATSLNNICIGLECIFFTYLPIILIGLQLCS